MSWSACACLIGAALVSGAAYAAPAAPAKADDYPSRPVRYMVPFAPGGAADFVARLMQPRLSEFLGQQVVIDNRAGAAGNVGMEVVARSSPDGYTIMLGSVGLVAINPVVFPKFPVIPLRDFIGIMQITDVPGALVVHPSVPVKSASEFVAYLKANPGKLNYGSPGAGSANRLEMEMFRIITGTQMTHVPYKGGAGQAVTALLGNEVQTMFVTFTSVVSFVKQGRLRMLGVVSPERNPVLPDVPAMPELGFPKLTSGTWQGLFVPSGTPEPVLKKLLAAGTRTMEHPEVVKRLAESGARVVISKSPAAFREYWKSEYERFAKVVRDAKIETE
jgi:tripartite-type tricarboxylate transporter receptor subunit TctC